MEQQCGKQLPCIFRNVLLLCIRIAFLVRLWNEKRQTHRDTEWLLTLTLCALEWTEPSTFVQALKIKSAHVHILQEHLSFIYALSLYNCSCLRRCVHAFRFFFLLLLLSVCVRVCVHDSEWSAVGMRCKYVRNIVQYFNFLLPTNYILSCILAFHQMKIASPHKRLLRAHSQTHTNSSMVVRQSNAPTQQHGNHNRHQNQYLN